MVVKPDVSRKRLPSIIVTNVRSVNSIHKVDELECIIKNNDVQIVCLTESWLKDYCPDDVVNISGFTTVRHDRNDGRRGGGVLCYVANSLSCRRLADLECNDVESLWLLCRYARMPRCVSHVIVGNLYFPPNGDGAYTVSYVLNCLDKITRKHPYAGIVLCGDFNQLNDRAIVSYPLKQIVSTATRRNNILDKIYTNISDWYESPSILPPVGTSDHNVVLLRCIQSRNVSSSDCSRVRPIYVRSSDPNGKTLLAHALSKFNWFSLYKMDDCNAMLIYFYSVVHDMLNKFLPVHVSIRYGSEKPWVNDRFKELIRQRQYAWQSQDTAKYRALRNLVQRTAKTLRSKYYGRCIKSLRNAGPKQWWRAVKRITGQSRENSLTSLSSDGDLQKLTHDINCFFQSVSADLLPLDLSLVPDVDVVSDEFIIEPYQVECKLVNLNPHKACGPDNIPNWFWRDFSVWLAEPLCAIFNCSIRHGVVPTSWKQADVVPVPKTNRPVDITKDLRPISLTSTLSKVLESFIGQWILNDLKGKLDDRQYGALRGRSTTHELVDILHHWHQALDNSSLVRAVFIDYAKAFDHVDHSIVVFKLSELGIAPVLIRWICSFLSGRQQRVKLSQYVSDWLTLSGSMPQGSYLGPLVFLVLINDLTAGCLLHKFVDDTTLSEIIPKGSSSNMAVILNDVVNWSGKNLMNINWKKTKEMWIGTLAVNLSSDILCVDDNVVERVNSFKLLGIVVEHNLKWKGHVDSICAKAASRLHFLKVLKRSALSIDDLLYFYKSAIRPVLEYACPAWHSSLTVEQTRQIESIQKRALRIIFNNNCIYYENFCNIHELQTLADRRNELCRSFFDKHVLDNNSCLHYLLPPPRVTQCPELRRRVTFQPIRARTVRFSKSFLLYALDNYQ